MSCFCVTDPLIARPLVVPLPDLAATAALGRALGRLLMPGTVIALAGPLGACKTTLARALIQAVLGPQEEVPSPTFTLVQTYDTLDGETIWHFDLYRLTTPEEALELGVEEAFWSGISLVEWPERLGALLPPDRLDITLTPTGQEEERQAHLHGHGRWTARMNRLASLLGKEQL